MIPHSATSKAGSSSWAMGLLMWQLFLVGTLVWTGVNEIQPTGLPESWSRLWVGTYIHTYVHRSRGIAFCNDELTAILHIQART